MGHNTKYIPPRKTKSFVALIRQSGTSSSQTQTSGTLTVGRTYYIESYVSNDDFSNVGGFGRSGHYFIATGTTPAKWTNGSVLSYNTGAPVVIGGILENTFAYPTTFGFTMEANGKYSFRSNATGGGDVIFTESRTIAEITNSSRPTITINAYRLTNYNIDIETLTNGVATNNILSPQSTPYDEANFIRVTVFI